MFKLLNIDLSHRVIGLDVMRSLAILSVVFGHYVKFFHGHLESNVPHTTLSFDKLLQYVVTGFDGVDLFFVLSGFLIGHSLLKAFAAKELNMNYLIYNFWIKRWFRTLPNYLVVLIVTMVLFYFVQSDHEVRQAVPYHRYFFFIQNIFRGELDFFPESWSLAIEEWFYILFPVLLTACAGIFARTNYQKQALLICIVAYIVTGVLLRLNYVRTHSITGMDYWNRDIRTVLSMRLDAIVYGVLMAFVKLYFPVSFKKCRYWFLAAGISLLLFSFALSYSIGFKFMHGYYFLFVGVDMALLLPFFYYMRVNRRLLTELFTCISVISYSLYLVNYSLVQASLETILPGKNLESCILKCGLATVLNLFISLCLYKFVEVPFMDLRKTILKKNDALLKRSTQST